MSWGPKKRFWTEVTVRPEVDGHGINLDGRPLRTPEKRLLVLPTLALAEAIAAEWRSIEGAIEVERLPLTRAMNTAIDRVSFDPDAVVDALLPYGDTDLLSYRAESPALLRQRQSEAWDPWLDWSARTLSAPLIPVSGVMHQPQPETSLRALRHAIAAHDPMELTALHDLVTLSGSLVLGLAVSHGALSAAEAWRLSRIDEAWQTEQWGADDEAEQAAAARAEAYLSAETLLILLRRGESEAQ